jgi:serine O-acetyltransferase
MIQQFSYFIQDVKRMLGKHKIRMIHIWLSRFFWGILLYRVERGMFLMLGTIYVYLRIIFIPLINLIQAYSNIDISYHANIKGGILILHPSAGIVVSGFSVIGVNLTLTGGNIIGAREGCKANELVLGDNCTLGANAVVLGPIFLGNHIQVGASACVIHSCTKDGVTLVGVPASEVSKKGI